MEPTQEIVASTNRADVLAVISRGVLGAIPVCGPIVAEVVGVIIPNQRVDRIVRLVEFLQKKIADLEQKLVEARLKTPEGVDLLEDSFYQAARALSDERLGYIANILRSGITEEQTKMAEKKRLMWLIGQLDDAEVILLTWYGQSPAFDVGFVNKHSKIVEPKLITDISTQQEIDDATMQGARVSHLTALGLLCTRHKLPKRGDLLTPQSVLGLIKAEGHDITPLGTLLLRAIGVQKQENDQ